jgi:hypothetical protein
MGKDIIMVEVGSGELVDKITILEIKSERISDQAKLKNVRHELDVLSQVRDTNLGDLTGLAELTQELKSKMIFAPAKRRKILAKNLLLWPAPFMSPMTNAPM